MRRAIAVQLAVLWVVASAAASAHASLLSSDPVDGSRLGRPPKSVSLVLTEKPELALSTFKIVNVKGRSVRTEGVRLVSEDPFTVRIALEPLDQGIYSVSWRVISRVDGHLTGGTFIFGVGVDPGDFVPTDTRVGGEDALPPLGVAGRFLLLAGLITLLGFTWVTVALFTEGTSATRRVMGGSLITSFLGLGLMADAQRRAAEVGFAELAPTFTGQMLIGRAFALILGAIALVVALRWSRARRWATAAAGTGAALAMLVHVAAGHAAASSTSEWTKVAVQWVHFLAVSVWLGGLLALLIGIRGTPGEDKASAVRRFSKVAGIALAAVLVSGMLRAINMIDRWENLFSTAYGRVVVVKAGFVVGLAGLGAINRYRNVPRADRKLRGLRLISGAELALATGILGLTALLVNLSPPAAAGGSAPQNPPVLAFGSDFATTMKVRLEISSRGPGTNEFELKVTDFDTGEPVDPDRVSLRFRLLGGGDTAALETALELRRLGIGKFGATVRELTIDGRMRVVVLIQSATESAEIELEVVARCRAEALEVRGGPQLYDIPLREGLARAYLDPGRPGVNDVYITFESGGGQLPAVQTNVFVNRKDTESMRLETRRLNAGQFIAGVNLAAGNWRFDFEAVTQDGEVLRGCFEEDVRDR